MKKKIGCVGLAMIGLVTLGACTVEQGEAGGVAASNQASTPSGVKINKLCMNVAMKPNGTDANVILLRDGNGKQGYGTCGAQFWGVEYTGDGRIKALVRDEANTKWSTGTNTDPPIKYDTTVYFDETQVSCDTGTGWWPAQDEFLAKYCHRGTRGALTEAEVKTLAQSGGTINKPGFSTAYAIDKQNTRAFWGQTNKAGTYTCNGITKSFQNSGTIYCYDLTSDGSLDVDAP